jgi:hypothetical protein
MYTFARNGLTELSGFHARKIDYSRDRSVAFVTPLQLASKNKAGTNAMECRDVDDYFWSLCRSEAVIPIDVASHLLQCEACHLLYQRLRPACGRVEVPEELKSRILTLIRTSLRQEAMWGHRK